MSVRPKQFPSSLPQAEESKNKKNHPPLSCYGVVTRSFGSGSSGNIAVWNGSLQSIPFGTSGIGKSEELNLQCFVRVEAEHNGKYYEATSVKRCCIDNGALKPESSYIGAIAKSWPEMVILDIDSGLPARWDTTPHGLPLQCKDLVHFKAEWKSHQYMATILKRSSLTCPQFGVVTRVPSKRQAGEIRALGRDGTVKIWSVKQDVKQDVKLKVTQRVAFDVTDANDRVVRAIEVLEVRKTTPMTLIKSKGVVVCYDATKKRGIIMDTAHYFGVLFTQSRHDVSLGSNVDYSASLQDDIYRATKIDHPRATKIDLPRATKIDLPRATKLDLPRATKIDLPRPTKIDLPRAHASAKAGTSTSQAHEEAQQKKNDYQTGRQMTLTPDMDAQDGSAVVDRSQEEPQNGQEKPTPGAGASNSPATGVWANSNAVSKLFAPKPLASPQLMNTSQPSYSSNWSANRTRQGKAVRKEREGQNFYPPSQASFVAHQGSNLPAVKNSHRESNISAQRQEKTQPKDSSSTASVSAEQVDQNMHKSRNENPVVRGNVGKNERIVENVSNAAANHQQKQVYRSTDAENGVNHQRKQVNRSMDAENGVEGDDLISGKNYVTAEPSDNANIQTHKQANRSSDTKNGTVEDTCENGLIPETWDIASSKHEQQQVKLSQESRNGVEKGSENGLTELCNTGNNNHQQQQAIKSSEDARDDCEGANCEKNDVTAKPSANVNNRQRRAKQSADERNGVEGAVFENGLTAESDVGDTANTNHHQQQVNKSRSIIRNCEKVIADEDSTTECHDTVKYKSRQQSPASKLDVKKVACTKVSTDRKSLALSPVAGEDMDGFENGSFNELDTFEDSVPDQISTEDFSNSSAASCDSWHSCSWQDYDGYPLNVSDVPKDENINIAVPNLVENGQFHDTVATNEGFSYVQEQQDLSVDSRALSQSHMYENYDSSMHARSSNSPSVQLGLSGVASSNPMERKPIRRNLPKPDVLPGSRVHSSSTPYKSVVDKPTPLEYPTTVTGHSQAVLPVTCNSRHDVPISEPLTVVSRNQQRAHSDPELDSPQHPHFHLQVRSGNTSTEAHLEGQNLQLARRTPSLDVHEGRGVVSAVVPAVVVVVSMGNNEVGIFNIPTNEPILPKLYSEVRYKAKRGDSVQTHWTITDLFFEHHIISASGSAPESNGVDGLEQTDVIDHTTTTH